MRLGNPHGRKPFTAEARRKGAEALRQQAHARAQQLSEILAEFAGQSANAIAKALNDRKLPTARGGSGPHVRSSTFAPTSLVAQGELDYDIRPALEIS